MSYNRNHGKRWTREELAKVRALRAEGNPVLVISRVLGRSLRSVACKAQATRRRTIYRQGTDGEVAVVPRNGWYKIACCDCGLVHLFKFATVNERGRVKGRVAFIARRDQRATAALRRHNKYPMRAVP